MLSRRAKKPQYGCTTIVPHVRKNTKDTLQKFTSCDVWCIQTFSLRAIFYCTALCVSAVFAVARCPFVHPSVCSSVTFVCCIQTAEDIVKLSRLGSAVILVFSFRAAIPNSKGNPVTGVQNTWWVGNICDFRLNFSYRFSPTQYEIGPWLL